MKGAPRAAGATEEPADANSPSANSPDAAIVAHGKEVVRGEAAALVEAADRLGEPFARAVVAITRCVEGGGKILVTGVGKSGLVARRIASTLTSLGSTSVFLHPVDALHGDVAAARPGDLVLAISNSGRSAEILALVPIFHHLGIPLLALTGGATSPLAREAEIFLDAGARSEAGHDGVAPTSSSAVAAALGDALAVAAARLRGFTAEDFAFSHPGGAIGRRLNLRVADIMHRGAEIPVVRETDRMAEAILTIAEKRLGMTAVVNEAGRLAGIITDGDLKRLLLRHRDIMDLAVRECMTPDPRTIEQDAPVTRALVHMEAEPSRLITCLLVVGPEGALEGVVHLHDCLQACLS